MKTRFVLAAALGALAAATAHAEPAADTGGTTPSLAVAAAATGAASAIRPDDGIPTQLDETQRAGYRAVFRSIRAGDWAAAQLQLAAMAPGPLHAIARAELYTARNSPRVDAEPLRALLVEAPELPEAAQIANLARLRGATDLPDLPTAQRLVWFDAAPVRRRIKSIRSDTAAAELAVAMQPFIKDDRGPDAEALVESRAADLTSDALTEWRQKVAWIYFLMGDDANARRVAAAAQAGSGDWVAQADWVQALAAWRQKDCATAGIAFQTVARHATDTELRSAGLYWASRADMACGRPDLVQGRLQAAAQYGETFYGLLARQALAIQDPAVRQEHFVAADWQMLERRPNVRVAAALVEIGEDKLADEVLRYQAKLSGAQEYPALVRLAGRLNLPATEIWLSHNGPVGAHPIASARYPFPNWAPQGGWRVDKALVFAHALQESRFDADVQSPAGAIGLLQVRPIAATDIARKKGFIIAPKDLTNPATNLEIGQSYIEQLRDQPFTGGLLPKVIAAYNAGPTPVQLWNAITRDGGDPLLYIESIPYWETRGYVMTVLRNYWMYERQEGRRSPSREALAQGMWPKFPGLPGAPAVRLSAAAPTNSYASLSLDAH